jgi:hypothetical protein
VQAVAAPEGGLSGVQQGGAPSNCAPIQQFETAQVHAAIALYSTLMMLTKQAQAQWKSR